MRAAEGRTGSSLLRIASQIPAEPTHKTLNSGLSKVSTILINWSFFVQSKEYKLCEYSFSESKESGGR